MRITGVRTAVIDGNFPWVLVRVETDTGVTGLGEAYWGAGVTELIHRAKPLLIGADPTNIARLVFVMERSLSGEGSQAGATVTAISGIEIALWDLMGRAHDLPISTFFGGRFREKIRIYRLPRGGLVRAGGLCAACATGGCVRLHGDQI
jgi:L-alanine-DL-glutamate epimerase-like enolase superfamily enzyme